MNKLLLLAILTVLGLLISVQPASSATGPRIASPPIRVLVVTGGHDFEKEPFLKLFQDNAEVKYTWVEHPKAHALLKADEAKNYDVLVLYDMHQEITDEAKADFLARLKEGKGLVVVHHAIASYQSWPEYWKIIGARYYLENVNINGVEKPRSTYQHDLHFKVQVADPAHPVTAGLQDYELRDETYKGYDMNQDVHVILTTQEPQSNRAIAWTKTYEAARVVYIQSGHDHFAYENPHYQTLLKNALRWTAKRN